MFKPEGHAAIVLSLLVEADRFVHIILPVQRVDIQIGAGY